MRRNPNLSQRKRRNARERTADGQEVRDKGGVRDVQEIVRAKTDGKLAVRDREDVRADKTDPQKTDLQKIILRKTDLSRVKGVRAGVAIVSTTAEDRDGKSVRGNCLPTVTNGNRAIKPSF